VPRADVAKDELIERVAARPAEAGIVIAHVGKGAVLLDGREQVGTLLIV
jgi:UDP-N-acetylglucosamine transferase subunit ALG13